MLRAEGGFEPLNCYIPTGLKLAPGTHQAHPRIVTLRRLISTYINLNRDIFMRI